MLGTVSVGEGVARFPDAACVWVLVVAHDLLQALKLHHSAIPGHGDRKINVELTAGGGGNKSEFRLKKIKERNDRLAKQRKIAHERREKRQRIHGKGTSSARSALSSSSSSSVLSAALLLYHRVS